MTLLIVHNCAIAFLRFPSWTCEKHAAKPWLYALAVKNNINYTNHWSQDVWPLNYSKLRFTGQPGLPGVLSFHFAKRCQTLGWNEPHALTCQAQNFRYLQGRSTIDFSRNSSWILAQVRFCHSRSLQITSYSQQLLAASQLVVKSSLCDISDSLLVDWKDIESHWEIAPWLGSKKRQQPGAAFR